MSVDTHRFDVITVGGGIAGSSLARALAAEGLSVLVLERELHFKDRVRGEQMQPWGCAEAEALGVWDLAQNVGHNQPWIDLFIGPHQIGHRNLAETTLQRRPHFNFSHAALQETLLQAALRAGARVQRGVTVLEVRPGARPSVVYENAGKTAVASARLVVGADGRQSVVRRSPMFETKADAPFLTIAGVLLNDMPIAEDTGLIHMNPMLGCGAYVFPQGGGRVRAYVAYPSSRPGRLSGPDAWPDFIATATAAGAPAHIFEGVTVAGPLASFDAADHWVEHPFAGGIALVGDAAATNDPSWGQGLSLTLRDARALRDALLTHDDWNTAGHAYAEAHDRSYAVVHDVTVALKEMFMRPGDVADARRERALPLIAADPTRVPDHPFCGPDLPWTPDLAARFSGAA